MNSGEEKVVRKATYIVTTKAWDYMYGCYYDRELATFDNYPQAELFCITYAGKESHIIIQKAWVQL